MAPRRTDRDIFLDKLTALSNGGANLITNRALREDLGWDEEKFDKVKARLKEEGVVIIGTGQGGKIGLAAGNSASKGLKAFISYSHIDEKLKDELIKHFEPLRHIFGFSAWNDRKINAGDEWEKSITSELASANVIILLVSIDFINSKFCYEKELGEAMERHSRGEAIVVPVVLRSCMWHHAPFAKLQALPKDGKAVLSWPNQDDAFVNVAEGLKRLLETVVAKQKSTRKSK